ncbi:Sulfite exporter TauE/SafE [Stieleria neptunia]|uniref:Probable membrane transporter protein n=1 Tax=Stieleria neptunia TaxID=2527979 RepID=A0A518HUC6_9BACT|nr:sulfite exporter TauE/SafE family protein [Stieleria neptunia]QDV44393.1 Sulfite exporter TauE/SafE [Stieleria neptunia]
MFSGDLTVFLYIGVIALAAGFVHSAIGFGFGIVAVTLLPLVVEVRQSHVVISTASVPVLMMAAWAYREGADWSALWRALVGAAICMPLGLLAFEWVSPDWLIRGTGLAILAMVGVSFRNRRRAKMETKSSGGSSWLAGALGGFLAGAVTIAGPPVAAYALSQPWEPARFKAFLNQFLFAVSFYKVTGLAVRGFIDQETLVQSAALAPMAIIGIQVGAMFSRRLSTRRFHAFVAIALVAVAIYFVVRGAGE